MVLFFFRGWADWLTPSSTSWWNVYCRSALVFHPRFFHVLVSFFLSRSVWFDAGRYFTSNYRSEKIIEQRYSHARTNKIFRPAVSENELGDVAYASNLLASPPKKLLLKVNRAGKLLKLNTDSAVDEAFISPKDCRLLIFAKVGARLLIVI
jgi:hypothetical protein